jgi:hypothetical protein
VAVAALIGAGISALTYTASVAFSEGGFNNWNWGSFAKQVGIGALSGAASGAVGSAYGGVGDFSKELSRAFTHGMVQANIAAYTGGNVGSSFLSGFIGSGVGSGTDGFSKAGQLGVSALSGAGLSTALSGGNFWENLAYSSAVVGLNHLMHKGADNPKKKQSQTEKEIRDINTTYNKDEYGAVIDGIEYGFGQGLKNAQLRYGQQSEVLLRFKSLGFNVNASTKLLKSSGKWLSRVGTGAGILSVGITVADIYQGNYKSNVGAGLDLAFGLIGFIGPVGAGVSATYFLVAKPLYEHYNGSLTKE